MSQSRLEIFRQKAPWSSRRDEIAANRLRRPRRTVDLKQHSKSSGYRTIRAGRRTDGRLDPAIAAEAAAMPRARRSSIRTEPGRDGLGRSFRWSFNNLPPKITPSKRTDRTRSLGICHTDRCQRLKNYLGWT